MMRSFDFSFSADGTHSPLPAFANSCRFWQGSAARLERRRTFPEDDRARRSRFLAIFFVHANVVLVMPLTSNICHLKDLGVEHLISFRGVDAKRTTASSRPRLSGRKDT